jgi:hypothetical protein
MLKRRRVKHTLTLKERLAVEAERLRERAHQLPMDEEREERLRKARGQRRPLT